MSYYKDAREDAADMVRNFREEIVEQILSGDEVSDDFFNDYPEGDAYHHETHVDKAYDLTEAAEVLSELRDFEETDSGLWQGLEPRKAISAQAAYTYGNAVYSEAQALIAYINENLKDRMDDLVCDLITEFLTH